MLQVLEGVFIVAKRGDQLLVSRSSDENYIINFVKGRRGGSGTNFVLGPFTSAQLERGPSWDFRVERFKIDRLVYDSELGDVRTMSTPLKVEVPGMPDS